MAVSLKGANDDKSTNSIIARSMGMGGGGRAKAGLEAQNPGHNRAPVKPKPQPQVVAAAPSMPGMPSEEAIRLGMPSAMAALKARRDGPPKEEKPLPAIKSKSAPQKKEESDADDDDDDLEELGIDKDDALSIYREKRMAELKAQAAKQQEFKQLGHGTYTEIKEEEFLPTVTKSKYAVCAFYHVDFERCKIVDKHLSQLAREHGATKFVKLNAEKAPFFIQKLAVKTLPTVVMFKDGIAVDRITGFEDFGGVDDFKTELMARRIAKKGVIVLKKEKTEKDNTNANIRPATNNDADAAAAGEDGAAADDD